MEIKFIESHSFVGESMYMVVNENSHSLEMDKNQTYAQHAIKLLKDIYNIDKKIEDIEFVWDGTL
jgi:hypothetical protein